MSRSLQNLQNNGWFQNNSVYLWLNLAAWHTEHMEADLFIAIVATNKFWNLMVSYFWGLDFGETQQPVENPVIV